MSRYRGIRRPLNIIRVCDEEDKVTGESILAHDSTFFDEEEIEIKYDDIETKEIDKSIVKLGYGLSMMKYRKNNDISNLVIDSGTKTIEKREYYNRDIKDVTLNDDLEVIEESAFKNNKIQALKLNSNLKVIGKLAFSDNQIKHVEFNEGLEIIDGHAFKNNKLTEINLPSTLRTIKICAFKGNEIKHVNLPDSVTEIDFGAFDFGVSFTYKGHNFDGKCIDYFGSDSIPKLAHIKSLVPNANLNNLTKMELKYLPLETDLVKGFFNNKKRFSKLKARLDISEEFRFLEDYDFFVPSEFEDFMKICTTLGYFNSNGVKLDELENKLIEIYETIGKSGVHKTVSKMKNMKYNKKLAEVALQNDDLTLLPQVLPSFFNRYEEISKGIIKSRQNDITKLNTARKKLIEKNLDTKEIDEAIKELKKNLKKYDLSDVIKYINNNTFVINEENPEMANIIPYLIGNIDNKGFQTLNRLLSLAKRSPENYMANFEGEKNNMNYKWLDNKDPLNLALGYIVDCCAKYRSLGEDIMIQSMTNPNIKNLVIYKNDKIIAKTTAFYNNDYILCNNIEVAHTFLENKNTSRKDLNELTLLIITALTKQAEYLNVNEVRIGLLRNDLQEYLECLAIYVEHRDLFENYKFKDYEGDANNIVYGQASVYIKTR